MACDTDITNYRPMLWCISPDEYAFSPNFSERYFITDLDMCPLSLDNIGPNLLIYNDPSSPQPPLIVRQQFESRQEYITLAPQVIILKFLFVLLSVLTVVYPRFSNGGAKLKNISKTFFFTLPNFYH